ncbi:MAG: response regulator [Scytonema hyalinum WJT4-NPBG1]|jgi:diguanylate cyclase (GGDEF)-like protein|nr:response regulator [Scytonema hyalinum WJT4-NPBG1]
MRILVIEDDELIANPLAQLLTDQHYAVDIACDGEAGWELAEALSYDLIVLDVMLPKLDGISLCRQMRSHGIQSPIILLTAQDSSTNKVLGLDAGADDYLTKPFDFQELLARIRALLRRGSSALPPLLEWENLRLDPSICEVTYDSKPLHLTPKEYGLLELFLRNPHRIFSCSAIIDQLWSFEEPPGEDTVRTHLKGLRMKLRKAGVVNEPIETVYGIGYRLRVAQEHRSTGAGGAGEDAVKGEKVSSSSSSPRQSPQVGKPFRQSPDATPLNRGNLRTGVAPEGNRSAERSRRSPPAALAHHGAGSSCPSSPTPEEIKQHTQTITASVWERTKDKHSERVTVIEQATTALLQDALEDELLSKAHAEAHKLAGSLGLFGFGYGSDLARQIEELLEAEKPLIQQQKLHLSELVVALRRELQVATTNPTPEQSSAADERPFLLVVSQDKSLAAELERSAANAGMRSQIATNPALAREQLVNNRPDVVVLELCGNTADEGLRLLAELNCCTPPVPVLVITNQDSLLDRVQIARLGGRGCLQKPVASDLLLETLTNLVQRSRKAAAKVMVVDDDPVILSAVCSLLQPWGLKVSTLENPLKFWETLETRAPDLLVLDVEMPQMSGIELCQVVRNDPRHCGLPVLFLTARTDADTMRRVFAAGADDYVNKPIVGPELVTRILNRLDRTRMLRTISEIDALTGVANRRQSTQELNQLLSLANRHNQPLCFAVLKIDHLQQINQQYGHAVGDEVLSRFGRLLRRHFQSEILCRWGGAEFVVGMYGMTQKDGRRWIEEILENSSKEKFLTPDKKDFQVTFSVGLSSYLHDGSDLQTLYQTALARCARVLSQRNLSSGTSRSQSQLRTK